MRDLRGAIDSSIAIVLIIIGYLALTGFFESFTATNLATVDATSLGVYWDSNCLREVYSIDWGSLSPGTSRTVTMYIRNEGDTAASLFLTTTGWSPPETSEYMSLNWDYVGQMLNPDQVMRVSLRLSLSPDMRGVTAFGFEIVMGSHEVFPPSAPSLPPSQSPPPQPPTDTIPPRISIISPESDILTNRSSLLVRWVGEDNGSGIDYYSVYLNGELQVKTSNTSCEVLRLIEGSNNVSVTAHDKAGNIDEDNTRVIVDNRPPSVDVSTLSGDKLTRRVTIRFRASDENLAETSLQIDDEVLDVSGMDSYLWDTQDVSDGMHTIKITGTDKAGNTNSSIIGILVDNTKPILSLLSPANGAVVADFINIRYTVFDITPVDIICITDHDEPINRSGRDSFGIDTRRWEDGLHTIKFVATDAVGNSIESTLKVIVDNTLPSVDLDAPMNGSYLGQTATITLTANDANFERMELHILGDLAETWYTSGPKEYDWNTRDCREGTGVVKATVYDLAGNAAEISIIVNIDKTSPNVSIISPSSDVSLAGISIIRFSASDVSLADVFLHIDGFVFDVSGRESYTWNTLTVGDGRHQIKIRAIDEAGNIAETQVAVRTFNQYLLIESITGILVFAFMISIYPLILSSKHAIL